MEKESAAVEARRLVRASKSGTLATLAGDRPFASLVTPAFAPDLSPLLWLSSLSAHSRHLEAAPACSLMLTGEPTGSNPQTTPRVTLACTAEKLPAEEVAELKERYLARHPYASLYAGFADFSLWRLAIEGAHMVGGFAQAQRLQGADLAPDPAAVAAVMAAEARVLGHVNADHIDALAYVAAQLRPDVTGMDPNGWRMVSVDVDGCDIAQGETVLRLAFAAPVDGAGGIRAELVAATQLAREAVKK